jgi:hypothetical protein
MSITLTTLNSNKGDMGLCDTPLLHWAIRGADSCNPCLSMMMDYWNIPVASPLSWIDNDNAIDRKTLSIDIAILRTLLDLPTTYYQPRTYYHGDDASYFINFTQTATRTTSFVTTTPTNVSVDVKAVVRGNLTEFVTVRMALWINGSKVDETFIDFSDIDRRHSINVFWAGIIPANPSGSIMVEIENVDIPLSPSPSIDLVEYKIKYIAIEELI